ELPEFDEFLPLWIEELGTRKGGCAKKLLSEAQSMLGDDFALLENARKYVDAHPELYLQFLEMKHDSKEEAKMLDIGWEAMDSISSDFTVRIIQIIVNFLKQQSSSQKDIPIEIMHLISQVCHNLVIQSHNIPAHDIQSLTDILYTISKDDKVMNEQSRICAQRSHTELSGGTL
ncbi:MAG: hypothetical protein J6A01_04110, partial [Proteobacteria bacterium]|nr:hypothetical protein [Pseudomonadota bacterium]